MHITRVYFSDPDTQLDESLKRIFSNKEKISNSKDYITANVIFFSDDESRQRLTGNLSFAQSHNGVRKPMTVKDNPIRVRDQTGDAREARKQVGTDKLTKATKISLFIPVIYIILSCLAV